MKPDFDALPFLVRNGGWFWIVLVLGFAALLVVPTMLLRHLRAVVKTRRLIAQLREAAHLRAGTVGLDEGRIVLAGRWRGNAIETAEELVALGEGFDIVVGRRGKVLENDDEVVAQGRLVGLSKAAADGSEPATTATWKLAGAEVFAAKPQRVRAKPMVLFDKIFMVVGLLVLSYVALRWTGSALADRLRSREYLPSDGKPFKLGNLDRMSLAASLPGSRDKALEGLEWALERHPYRDDESVRRRLALADLMHGTCGRWGFLPEGTRYEDQLALARRCDYRGQEVELLLRLGEYEGVWDRRTNSSKQLETEGIAAIAIANWSGAAEKASEMARRYDHFAEIADGDSGIRYKNIATRYGCLAQWFRSLGGDAKATDALRSMATGQSALICAPIIAESLAAEDRKTFLRTAIGTAQGNDRYSGPFTIASTLLWIEGDASEVPDLFSLESSIGRGEAPLPDSWLFQSGLQQWRGGDARAAVVAISGVVLLQIQRGDFAAARRAANEALTVAQGPTGNADVEESARDLLALVAFREGLVDIPNPGHSVLLNEGVQARLGATPEHGMAAFPESCPMLVQSVADAQRGDGATLVRVMQSCDVFWTGAPEIVLGVLPRIRQGRAELATALRWWHADPVSLHEPFSSLAYAALRRDIARLAGDTDSAEEWGAIAKRLSVPLDDPTRRLALVLWNEDW